MSIRMQLPLAGRVHDPELPEGDLPIIVDLHDLPLIDSARLAWLMRLRFAVGRRGLRLERINQRVAVQLRQLGVDRILDLAA